MIRKTITGSTIALSIWISGCVSPAPNGGYNRGGWGNSSEAQGQPPVWGTPQPSSPAADYPSAGVPGVGYPGSSGQGLGIPSATHILVELLMRQLGLSQQQAMGGAGAIFQVARDRLTPDQFGQVRGAIPGIDNLIGNAPSQGGSGNMGNSIVGVVNTFQTLGMDPNMIGQFVPVIFDFVRAQGNAPALQLLQGAFTF